MRIRRIICSISMMICMLLPMTTVMAAGNGSVVALDTDQIGQPSEGNNIVFSKERHGLYAIKESDLVYAYRNTYEVVFYDLEKDTYETVYTSGQRKIQSSYVSEDAAYFLSVTKTTELSETVAENGMSGDKKNDVTVYRLDFGTGKMSQQSLTIYSNTWDDFNLGVDAQGRYYLASDVWNDKGTLYLLDSNGRKLDQCKLTCDVEKFYGFDPTNGNFYYGGYEGREIGVMAGNVTNNRVAVTEKNIVQLRSSAMMNHTQPVKMQDDRYLSIYSPDHEVVILLDSNHYDYTDYKESSLTNTIVNGVVTTLTSSINIAHTELVKFELESGGAEYEKDGIYPTWDKTCIGPKCMITEDGKTFVHRTSDNCLDLYDISTKEKRFHLNTTYPVYTFGMEEDGECVVVERQDGKLYVETLDWTYPTDFTIEQPTLTVGDYVQLDCNTNSAFDMDYTYSSADASIVSVDKEGRMNAWRKGTTTITVTAPSIGVTHTVSVTVRDSQQASAVAYSVKDTTGMSSFTMHAGAYRSQGSTKKAYLSQLADGSYERVEYVNEKLIREVYNASYVLQSHNEIPMELPIFGGYYAGADGNYVVVGQRNPSEDDNAEVIRVIRYDKNWNRIGACSIYGSETWGPFDAGSLSMVETGGKLYIHTCHSMYDFGDGVHHQANCTFVVQESDMTLAEPYSDAGTESAGYVSHSFMQKIATDGDYIYRMDLGDTYPRGFFYSRTPVDSRISKPDMIGKVVNIPGQPANTYTGYLLGGLQLSDEYWIAAGSGVEALKDNGSNVFVVVGHKHKEDCETKKITQNGANSNIRAYSPKLVRLNANQFLLLWEEKNGDANTITTKMALLNPDGSLASDIYTSPLALADCEPIVNAQGQVVWYVTNQSAPIFVTIDPYQLAAVQEQSRNVTTFAVDNGNGYYGDGSLGYGNSGTLIDEDEFWEKYFEDLYKDYGNASANPSGDAEEEEESDAKANSKNTASGEWKVGTLYYKKIAKNKVSVAGITNQKAKKVTIPATVKIKGKKYTVTAIEKNVFSGCKSLKQITVKSTKITKIGKNAFKNGNKKAVIKVPKSKKKAYKKLLKKAGYKGKVK